MNYYTSRNKMFTDFLVGFLCVWLVHAIFIVFHIFMGWLIALVAESASDKVIVTVTGILEVVSYIIWVMPLVVCLGVMFISFVKQRKFIGFGILTSVVIGIIVVPSLGFGACLLTYH